eukprot:sb/3478569/
MGRRLIVLCLLILSLSLVTDAAKRGKGRKGGKNGKGGKGKGGKGGKGKGSKMMKMDACTMAGHPCMLGQECVVEKYTGEDRCVCTEYCPEVPDAQVCGM